MIGSQRISRSAIDLLARNLHGFTDEAIEGFAQHEDPRIADLARAEADRRRDGERIIRHTLFDATNPQGETFDHRADQDCPWCASERDAAPPLHKDTDPADCPCPNACYYHGEAGRAFRAGLR